MWIWSDILAQDDIGEGLFYVIAVLILSIIGAVFEKFKRKMGDVQEEVKKRPPVPRRQAPSQRKVVGERPAARPVARAEGRPAARPPVRRRPRPPQRPRPQRQPVIVEIESELPSVVPVQPALEVEADVEHAELSTLKSTLASKTMPREKKPGPAEAVKAVEFKEIGSFKDL
ncbi:MAG: hypothetical protein JSV03_14280, partial [Planctomycetota bacterium]